MSEEVGGLEVGAASKGGGGGGGEMVSMRVLWTWENFGKRAEE